MTTYLSRKPMDVAWTEMELNDIEAMERFIDGPIESYELPLEISLISNRDSVLFATYKDFSTAVVEKDGAAQPFFGNVFLASNDPEGNAGPLNQSQKDWLAKCSDTVTTPNGQRILRINPFL